ncbi:MAG: hypothetical protein KUG74_09500 [Rhodobacteraceae bacterium]|nr:hypothetical protein [Paracoccaceae bacterium]
MYTDLQSFRYPNEINDVDDVKYLDKAGTAGEPDTHDISYLTKENAANLAEFNGVNSKEKASSFRRNEYQERADSATALAYAIADCDPRDACTIMAAALGDLSIGSPIAPFANSMAEAREWAACASTPELKAYVLACYCELTPIDQAGFQSHISCGAAA